MIPQGDIKDVIRRLVDFYSKLLGMGTYKIDIQFDGYENLECNYADIYKQSDCKEIQIRFNCEKLVKERSEIEKTVIHELMHAALWPFRKRVQQIGKNFINDIKAREMCNDDYSDDEHQFIFLMEEVLCHGFQSQSQKEMGHKPRRKNKACKKDIQKNKCKK